MKKPFVSFSYAFDLRHTPELYRRICIFLILFNTEDLY